MSSKGNMCRCAKRVPRGLSWRPAQARGVQGLPGGHTFKAERWGSEPSLSAWLDVPDRRAGEDQNFARDLWLPFISPEQKRSASPLPSPSRSIRISFIARCWSTQTTSLERDGRSFAWGECGRIDLVRALDAVGFSADRAWVEERSILLFVAHPFSARARASTRAQAGRRR